MSFTIGIRGSHPGCGKDTVTKMITEYLRDKNINITHKKFATQLRKVLCILTGIPVKTSETTEGKNIYLKDFGMTVGQVLQKLGTEIIKNNTYPSIWVDSLFRNIKDDENIIISDVRFPNEQESVRNRNGIIILVNSDRCIDPSYMASRSTQHASETSLNGIAADYTIENNSTLKDLKKQVKTIIKKAILRKKKSKKE